MFFLLLEKELKNLILSPKFAATFAACTLLLLMSIQAGIIEYKNGKDQYDAATAFVQQELHAAEQWHEVGNRQRIYRSPQPMQIFVSGIHFDIGRYSVVSAWQDIKLRQSAYSVEPIFAVFRSIDFVFIVQVVLSLLTIVFSYDLISGEKQSGTLRLMLSNAVPRTRYIAAKFAGAWIGLMVPLLIPLLIGILLLLLNGVTMEPDDWGRLAKLSGFSALYLTAFLSIGLCVSSFTRRSNMSFLWLLVFWIVMVLVLPRSGMMIASQIHQVPTASEVESKKDAYAQARRAQYFEDMSATYQERAEATASMSEEEREAYEEENEWDFMLENDALQKAMEADITESSRKIEEEAMNLRSVQQHLGFALSRISPASSFQLAGMALGATDLGLKDRFLLALQTYRTVFQQYVDNKNPGGGVTFGHQPETEPLDLSDMPRFVDPDPQNTAGNQLDALVLVLYTIFGLALSFIGFNRYDVR